MGIEFKEAKIADHFDEAKALMQNNAEETGFKHLQEDFEPKLEQYLQLEQMRMLRLFVVQHDDKLVGYCVMILVAHHHYGGRLWATQDVLYIDPSYRGHTSIKFIKYIDKCLREDKDIVISRTVSVRRDYSKVLKKLGYNQLETVYVKGE